MIEDKWQELVAHLPHHMTEDLAATIPGMKIPNSIPCTLPPNPITPAMVHTTGLYRSIYYN